MNLSLKRQAILHVHIVNKEFSYITTYVIISSLLLQLTIFDLCCAVFLIVNKCSYVKRDTSLAIHQISHTWKFFPSFFNLVLDSKKQWWIYEYTCLRGHAVSYFVKVLCYKPEGRGRAIAQAVSRRLPTAAALVQTRVWSCGILWWTKVTLGQVFSENFGFLCQSTFHLLLHYQPRLAQ
jgi:hypothetical protein